MAVLPDIVTPTAEVTIEGIQVGDLDVPLTEDQERLSQLIWKKTSTFLLEKVTYSRQPHGGK